MQIKQRINCNDFENFLYIPGYSFKGLHFRALKLFRMTRRAFSLKMTWPYLEGSIFSSRLVGPTGVIADGNPCMVYAISLRPYCEIKCMKETVVYLQVTTLT